MRISIPRGVHVGAVHAQRPPPGPPPTEDDEPLGSDEEWVTDSEEDESGDTAPQPALPAKATIERNGMGSMARMQNSGVHADFY